MSENSKTLRSYVNTYWTALKIATALALGLVVIVGIGDENIRLLVFGPVIVLAQHYFQSAFLRSALVLCDIADRG